MVFQHNFGYSQTPLAENDMLLDTSISFSGIAKDSCSWGGKFQMICILTSRIVKCWSGWNLCAILPEQCNGDTWPEARSAPVYICHHFGTSISIEYLSTICFIYTLALLCATVCWYHTCGYSCRLKCLYTVFDLSVIRYVLLKTIHQFYP